MAGSPRRLHPAGGGLPPGFRARLFAIPILLAISVRGIAAVAARIVRMLNADRDVTDSELRDRVHEFVTQPEVAARATWQVVGYRKGSTAAALGRGVSLREIAEAVGERSDKRLAQALQNLGMVRRRVGTREASSWRYTWRDRPPRPVVRLQLADGGTLTLRDGVPRCRAECPTEKLPSGFVKCGYIRCRAHLWRIDAEERLGSHSSMPNGYTDYTLGARWLENPTPPTCALDVADRGEHEPSQVARYVNGKSGLGHMGPSIVRLIVNNALRKLRAAGVDLHLGINAARYAP